MHAHRRPAPRGGGFTLVVTVSLMLLLGVLGIALLSLSAVTLRAGAGQSALAEARANARLAVLLALGELQRHAGPDQCVTAPGAILAEQATHPHWTGAWDSWHAGPEASGKDQPSAHSTLAGAATAGLAPSYEPHREDHFRAWLVSLPAGQSTTLDAAAKLPLKGTGQPAGDATAVRMVGPGSLGSAPESDHVHAALTPLSAGRPGGGRLGWWVADESLKARLLPDDFAATPALSLAERIFRTQSAGNPGIATLPAFAAVADEAPLALVHTRRSAELLDGFARAAPAGFHDATPCSLGILCDVREGGLKRDLSALLERPVNLRDTGDEFMLYRFGRGDGERVPLQDLAAYHQLYRAQVRYASPELRGGVQINNPDFGSGPPFLREYTNLYRLPVPIKVQFLVSLIGEPRTAAEKNNNPQNTDSHKLNIGITPAVTYWNPNNIPLTMNLGEPYATQFRFFNLPLQIKWTKEGKGYTSTTGNSLAWIANGAATGDRDTGFTLYLSGTRQVVFAPGEVRVFSLANTALHELKNSDVFKPDREVVAGWNPDLFIRLRRSDRSNNPRHVEPPGDDNLGALTFNAGDRISFAITPTETVDLANGSALQFFNRQASCGAAQQWMARQYQLVSRLAGAKSSFNRDLMSLAFPAGKSELKFEPRSGREIIDAGPLPFLMVNLAAGCETHESANSGPFAGRHFPSRPFLHSSPVTGTVFIDRSDPDSLYQHGWNWWIEDINSVFEANVSIDRNNRGYYGGGYTAESGSTHVVQQEIPAAPPISIAALSHAHLGGFSLANSYLGPGASNTVTNFQATTASGQGGLFPHTVQAIGNSYAHPHLPPDRAHGTWLRDFSEETPSATVTFADHSYLANKALWDEFLFSSISPATTRLFGTGPAGTAREVARRFFFHRAPLPNRRFTPWLNGLDEAAVDTWFTGAAANEKCAEQVAGHMLLDGPFNVNSTSVAAWRAVLASLRGRNVPFLDTRAALAGRLEFGDARPQGTPLAQCSLPNGPPATTAGTDPASPAQWTGWRELSDQELDQLAAAIVRQVRLRGPFLSLSEFINRRLDGNRRELALKGAVQAALDDPAVSINAGFRNPARSMGAAETAGLKPAFPEALAGPVAYGSAAYVDQADVLRAFGCQLTPRGDTFLIRGYGDSLDATGKVVARAWCEAVVQRVPAYLDPTDEAPVKQALLGSAANRRFGRRFHLVGFRYLNPAEV